ncbi:uncharacterized protein BT62DRAFT_926257 [Guyanagaster necrorhizus]|uniref:Uncharacterized protein n=1 Tax=Guyanagaster necrorhizus TaxID=856835 RepID=A0A9P8AZK6_9AGAR|nr:uncharacterized protein BT62DRAFT_926257 [Guyanagaster necrorhizus MCA 3950]KAG7452047.1 hypothetical protein BT62DRAFT_926257 [Guyanagaster necrorhizus MCA 3950]
MHAGIHMRLRRCEQWNSPFQVVVPLADIIASSSTSRYIVNSGSVLDLILFTPDTVYKSRSQQRLAIHLAAISSLLTSMYL